jgi:prevent-host-death family protein
MQSRLEVGAYEAKTRLAALLDEVERGHAVTITRHGEPVAVMVPAAAPVVPPVADVVAALKALRRGRSLGMDVKAAIAEGRR